MRLLLAAFLAFLAVDAKALSMSGGGGGCTTDCTFTSVTTNGTAPSLTATGAVFTGSVTVTGSNNVSVGGNLGIGTASPAAKLEVKQAVSDTFAVKVSSNDGTVMLSQDKKGLVTHLATTPTGDNLEAIGATFEITGGGVNQFQTGLFGRGSASTYGIGVAGFGTANAGGKILYGVFGMGGSSNGGTTGSDDYGGYFAALPNATTQRSVGAMGVAKYGSTKANYGGYFALQAAGTTATTPNGVGGGTTPNPGSAALAADNRDQVAPILLTMDNGTTAFMVADGGFEISRGTKAVTTLSAGCGAGAQFAAGSNDNAGRITVQTTGAMTCVMTFNSGWPDSRVPACAVNNETTANLARATPTNTQVTIAGTTVAGDVISYVCRGL